MPMHLRLRDNSQGRHGAQKWRPVSLARVLRESGGLEGSGSMKGSCALTLTKNTQEG